MTIWRSPFVWPEKKKVDLIERTNRAFFLFLSQLELQDSGNETPACVAKLTRDKISLVCTILFH